MRSEIFREIEESRRRFLDEAAAALNTNLTYFIPLEGNTLHNEKMEEPFYEESPGTDEKKYFLPKIQKRPPHPDD